MSIIDSVKRAPRWAWLTAAGVGIGAGAVKLWRDRAAPPADPTADTVDGTGVGGNMVGIAPSPTTTGAPASGVVVPPVIIGGSNGDNGSGSLGVLDDVFQGFASLVATVSQGNLDINTNLTSLIDDLANAGGPPGQVAGNPTPIVVNVPAPQPAPAPVPGPHSAPAPGPAPAPVKPCCTYEGHPLSWWQNKGNAFKSGKGWNWPFDSAGYAHSRAFAGHHACDGGGVAGGSKREC